MQQPILQRIPPQIPPNYYPASRPNFIQRPPTLRTMNPQPLSTDRNRLYNNQFSQNTINKPNIPIRYPQPRLILPN